MAPSRTAVRPACDKTCTGCNETKPITEFHKQRGGRNGLQSRCRMCTNAARRDFRARHPERHRAVDRAYYERNREKARAYYFEKHYGVSVDQFDVMVADQDGRCALCGRVPEGERNVGTLHMDHDHDTDVVRLPICQNCNNGLGHFKDNPDLLMAAAAYVEAFR